MIVPMSSNDEHTLLTDAPQLHQGDVFVWHDRHYIAPWQTFGVIITADCDLVQGKTHGRLSYVPALTMQDYIWKFWLPDSFAATFQECETKFHSRLNKGLERLRGTSSSISKEAATTWARRVNADQLIGELGLSDPGQAKDLKTVIENYTDVRDLLQADKPDFDLLGKCYRLKNKKASTANYSDLARDIQNSVVNAPGDVFFLSGVTGYEEFGLFAMLRHISQCDVGDLALSAHQLRWGTAKAKRIARLNSPYVFSLTQNLAKVFSDIGLPHAYDERRKKGPVNYLDSIYAGKS
jgi:hypothetical protein